MFIYPNSHPTRVRGLKLFVRYQNQKLTFAPHTGAWIETFFTSIAICLTIFAPHTGAWIETNEAVKGRITRISHPTRVRGLKH